MYKIQTLNNISLRGLERLQFPHQRIELLVGDRGAGVDVVELVVPPNLAAERFDAFSRRGRHGSDGQPRQRSRVATNSVSASRASRSSPVS